MRQTMATTPPRVAAQVWRRSGPQRRSVKPPGTSVSSHLSRSSAVDGIFHAPTQERSRPPGYTYGSGKLFALAAINCAKGNPAEDLIQVND
jgi:hypothetical protein